MSEFTTAISELRQQHDNYLKVKGEIDKLLEKLSSLNDTYATMLEAQQLLATLSDNNTTAVLDYITGVINKALAEIFPYDERRIYLDKVLYRGQYAHIKVKLLVENGIERNMELQNGNGLRQIVSFLFVVSLIEIRKGRRLLQMDELLNGLHNEAKRIIMDIMQIFAEEGFQFIAVEYGVNNVGKIYLVEKPGDTATVTAFGDGDYNDEVFVFNRPVEDIDKTIKVEESGFEDE